MVKQVRGADQDEVIRLCNGIRRGDVLKIDLRGAQRQELRGPHYCVVVSNDTLNASCETVVVVPLTTHGGKGTAKLYEVAIPAGEGELNKDGAAVPHQVRTIHRHEGTCDRDPRSSSRKHDAGDRGHASLGGDPGVRDLANGRTEDGV